MVKELLECFKTQNCKRQIRQSLQLKSKKERNKGNELYVKWKGFDNSFSNCIGKKRYYIKWVISLNHIVTVETK